MRVENMTRARLIDEVRTLRDRLNRVKQPESNFMAEKSQNAVLNILEDLQNEVDERKRIENIVRESEEKHRLAMQATRDGIWDWDIITNRVDYSPSWANIIGEKKLEQNLNTWKSRLHPDDQKRVLSSLNKHLKGESEVWQEEHRLKTKSGEWKWVLGRGEVVSRDSQNKPYRMIGTLTDISETKQTQAALAESENRLRSLIAHTAHSVFCYEYNPPISVKAPVKKQIEMLYEGVLKDCNLVCAKSYGAKKIRDVIGKTLIENFGTTPGSLNDFFRQFITNHYRSADQEGVEILPDSSKRYYLNSAHGVIENDKLIRVWGTYHDITDQKKTEETLRRSEETIRAIIETTHDWIWAIDLNRNHTYSNPAIKDILGYSPHELIGKSSVQFIHEEDRALIESKLPEWIAKKTGWKNLVIRWRHKNGSIRWLESNAVPIFDSQNHLTGFRGVDRDITDRKMAEKYIMESEERYHELFNHMSSGVAVYKVVEGGKDFIFRDFNKAGERIDNQKREFLIGKSIFDVRPGVEKSGLIDAFRKVLKTGKPVHHPVSFYEDNRLAGWYENYIYLLPSGELVAVFDNVTKNKQDEEALLRSEERYRHLVESLPDLVYSYSANRGAVFWSSAVEKTLGFTLNNLKQNPGLWHDSIHPDDIKAFDEAVARFMKGGSFKIEYRIKDASGNWRWLLDRSVGRREEKGEIIIDGIAKDITGRKLDSMAVRESEVKFRTLFENAAAITVLHDMKGQFLDVNTMAVKKWGYSKKELLKMHVYDIDPDFMDRHDPDVYWSQLRRQKSVHFEVRHRRKDGAIFPAEMILSQFLLNGQEVFMALGLDITQRKQAEAEVQKSQAMLKRLTAQLIRAHEEERKRLSRELHDEMGQSLTEIKLNLASIQDEFKNRIPRPLSEILNDSDQMVEDLLEKMHDIALNLRPSMLDDLGLAPAVKWLVTHCRKRSGLEIDLQFYGLGNRLEPDIETTVYRIVQESLNNIIKHARARKVLIRVRKLKSGKVRLTIKDDGCGFDIEQVERQDLINRGIGIMGMQERTSNLGGSITIQSKPKKGTAVRVELPSVG